MKSDAREIYCIDASAFITMHRFYPLRLMPDLWRYLEELFEKKKILSHQIVFDEIVPKSGKKDELAQWLTAFRANFISTSQRQLELVPDVLSNFPKLIDPESEKDQADPWMVTMLIEIMEQDGMFGDQSNYVMVTTESEKRATRLPAACRHYNIRHMNLFQFFEANGFEFTVKKI
ncbi:DUF4411 family protein [Candidatus Sulfidibacterium hydrothermale]|uniref:DUF4411 family protein n=1 Tax=Candidatus Sulfidibacterium hydrothermale TaxID=2875962 RepID=UPI001F0AE840|nr:DUF4411 family protein [Candidatus Sulfidibacterium hydrothermale]UBM61550.1 DUF4411 family protein [Candidatus Sulfidibacterium hydrothermale]